MITQQQERFVWRDGDVVVDDQKVQDPHTMSASEKAFFLKSQDKKQK